MASRNNKDYQGKTNQHDQINVADDQVSVNQDHQQSHEQIGDDGKSSINSGLEPMSQAIANETSPRDGITGDELYGNSQSNSKVTTNNTHLICPLTVSCATNGCVLDVVYWIT